jgi:DNA-binding response OmpR family regulator
MKIRGRILDISGGAVGGSIFVLLVDDDAAFVDAAARCLEAVGIRTVVALGSIADFDAFDGGTIDAVVIDVKLLAGDTHVRPLARMIRNNGVRLPIILMTTYPEPLEGKVGLPGSATCNPMELAELCRDIRARLVQ